MSLTASIPISTEPTRNPPQRIVILTRKFWPYSGTSEMAAADLASSLKRSGYEPHVVTIRWEKTWPQYFQFREFSVTRLNRSANAPWGGRRFNRSLYRTLDELRTDAVIAFGLGEESWAMTKQDKLPFVVRIDNQWLSNPTGASELTSKQLAILRHATAVLPDSLWTETQLKLHPELTDLRCEVVPDLIFRAPPIARQNSMRIRQSTARVAISEAHPVLAIQPDQPLAVCSASLNNDLGIFDLISAWDLVLQRWPNAKLWISSEGPHGEAVWDRICESNLKNSVILPGTFDELEDLYAAADLYIHPLRSPQPCNFLNRALAHGLCPLITDSTQHHLIEDGLNGLVTPSGNPLQMASAIGRLLENADLRARLSRAALKSAINAYDGEKIIRRFLMPFIKST